MNRERVGGTMEELAEVLFRFQRSVDHAHRGAFAQYREHMARPIYTLCDMIQAQKGTERHRAAKVVITK